ncbi:terminase [Acetobacter tropicalis]|uniref:terminase n=1 Tax=Acetobacter tropicalis TaxID=104102 RepID=UPI003975AF1D
MARKSSIDWAAVEADFRAGAQSNRQLSEKYGVAESSIRKRIKAEGWVRTNASKVRTKPQSAHQPARTRPAAPAKQDSIPQESADHHLNDRISALASRLVGELEDATAYLGEIADAIEEETAEDRSDRRKQAMLKAISTRDRAETLRTLKQIQMMEAGKAGKKGVKEERKEAAEKAAKGRFARMASPKLVVNNGK